MKTKPTRAQSIAMLAFLLASGVALASAPLQRTQAPGYYRLMLGDFEVTALSDGTLPFNVGALLKHVTPAQLDADLARVFLKEPVETSVNAFLVNTGARLVLIDTGIGPSGPPSAGRLLANLRAAGYRPEEVDDILITHMHGDHIGGLSRNGQAVFPNATVHAARAEAEYWLSEARMNAAPAARRGAFRGAMAALKPYVDAMRFETFDDDVEVVPGIRAVAAPGHTPGHTMYLVSSRGEQLLLWGDLVHVAAVQFLDPSVTISFDSDSAQAARERLKIFAMVAAKGYLIGGAHLSFPGLGHLRANRGAGYTFVPVSYTLPRTASH